MIHDFIDDDIARQWSGVWQRSGRLRQLLHRRRAIRVTAERNAIGLRLEDKGVDNACLVRVNQQNAFTTGTQREAKLRLVERRKPAGWNYRRRWHSELVR